MSLKIRLSRMGKRSQPKYKIIVIEGSKKRDGRYVERIGFYDPIPSPHILQVDQEKLNHWSSKGAQLSPGAHRLIGKLLKKK